MLWRAASLLLAIASAGAVVACTSGPEPTPTVPGVFLATQEPSTSDVCPTALIQGRLVRDDRSGLGIAGEFGPTTPVRWPHGFSARLVDAHIELLNQVGRPVARQGDTVEAGGGLGTEDFFFVCPPAVFVRERAP